MRRRMIVVAVLCLLLWTGLAGAQEKLVASGHPEYPPIMWRDGNAIVGVGPEVARLAFKGLGIDVTSRFVGDWAQAQEAQKRGDVDVLVGVYMTEERKAVMEYSVPYTKDPVAIFTVKGKAFPYSAWSDLIGKKGTTTTGDSYGQEFDAFMAAKLTVGRSPTVRENFDKLLSGEADYFIFARYSGVFEAMRLKISDKVEYLPKPVTVENFFISVGKKSPYAAHLPEVNKRVEGMVKDGTVDRLIEKYTKEYEAALSAKTGR